MKTETQVITTYTRKMLAAWSGLQVQKRRLYEIDCEPGVYVPSRFKSVAEAMDITARRRDKAASLCKRFTSLREDRLNSWEAHEAEQRKLEAVRQRAFPKILGVTDGDLPVKRVGDTLQLLWKDKVLAIIGVGVSRYVRYSSFSGKHVPFDHVTVEVRDGYEAKSLSYDLNRKAGLNVDKIVETLRFRLALEKNRDKEARERAKNTKSLRERVQSTLEHISAVEDDTHYVRDWNGRGGKSYPYYKAELKDGCLKVEVAASSAATASALHYQIYTKLTDDQMHELAPLLRKFAKQNEEVKRDSAN